MKVCSNCSRLKHKPEFTKKKSSKDGLNARCRTCTRAMSKKHFDDNKDYYREKQKRRRRKIKKRIREIILSAKDVPCIDCNKTFHFSAMDFDHVKGKKLFNIAYAVRLQVTTKTLLEEISKCEVVCANCHRIRTYKRIHKLL